VRKGATRVREICGAILVIIVITRAAPAAFAAAPALAPATLPTTQASPHDLHVRAYELMRAEHFQAATPLLNRAFAQTPPAQRTRALVLNLAILHLVHRQNVLRGVKELNEYLSRSSTPDEAASNILGAALNVAADNPKWREGPIYAAALREFARREAVLERTRPGFRRWGGRWVTEAEMDAIKAKQAAFTERLEAASANLQQLSTELRAMTEQYNDARKLLLDFAKHNHARMNGGTLVSECPECQAAVAAQEAAGELTIDMRNVTAEIQRATRAYQAMNRQEIRPDWPTRFDPIDPAAPEPAAATPPPALGLEAATQPTWSLR
jgi:hypothetical protein